MVVFDFLRKSKEAAILNNHLPNCRHFLKYRGLYIVNYGTHNSFFNVQIRVYHNLSPYFIKIFIYSTYLFNNKSIDIISNHNKSKPLFLYLAHQGVHTPIEAPKESLIRYKNIEHNLIKFSGRKTYGGMLSIIDDGIGNIINTLKKNNMYNNTIIIITSDNGGLFNIGSNGYLKGGKRTVWEGGVKVPTIFWRGDDIIDINNNKGRKSIVTKFSVSIYLFMIFEFLKKLLLFLKYDEQHRSYARS